MEKTVQQYTCGQCATEFFVSIPVEMDIQCPICGSEDLDEGITYIAEPL
ncbi:MAG: hypothetical protein K6T83_03710 [Alicyclobacillus sp.]|nr:hypothetical protein [Alicyclobacillus sp.]